MSRTGRINGSRRHNPHAATTLFNKKDPSKRIIARGTLFVTQERTAERGDAKWDNWSDLGRATTKVDAARQAGVEL